MNARKTIAAILTFPFSFFGSSKRQTICEFNIPRKGSCAVGVKVGPTDRVYR